MIKNIIFDFGGVLTLLAPDEALRRFKALGVDTPEKYINQLKGLEKRIFSKLYAGKFSKKLSY